MNSLIVYEILGICGFLLFAIMTLVAFASFKGEEDCRFLILAASFALFAASIFFWHMQFDAGMMKHLLFLAVIVLAVGLSLFNYEDAHSVKNANAAFAICAALMIAAYASWLGSAPEGLPTGLAVSAGVLFSVFISWLELETWIYVVGLFWGLCALILVGFDVFFLLASGCAGFPVGFLALIIPVFILKVRRDQAFRLKTSWGVLTFDISAISLLAANFLWLIGAASISYIAVLGLAGAAFACFLLFFELAAWKRKSNLLLALWLAPTVAAEALLLCGEANVYIVAAVLVLAWLPFLYFLSLPFLYKALRDTCWSGNLARLRRLVSLGANVREYPLYSPSSEFLVSAALFGRWDVVKTLHGFGADVNERDGFGKSALHFACAKGNKEMVAWLMECGADNSSDLLLQAAQAGDADKVKMLRDCGAKLDSSSKKSMEAVARADRDDVFKAMLLAGFDANAEDANGKTALMYAVQCRKLDTVKALLSVGVYVNARDAAGKSALGYAADDANQRIMEVLIHAGAEIEGGMLISAVRRGSSSTVETLISAGADVNVRDGKGLSVLQYAVDNADEKLAGALLAAGAGAGTPTPDGTPLLAYAAQKGYASVVKAFVAAGADVDIRDEQDKTALMYAAECGDISMLKCLLAAGADTHTFDIKCKTALSYAVGKRNMEAAGLLLRAGGYTPVMGTDGLTPLQSAAKNGEVPLVNFLLEFCSKNENNRKEIRAAIILARDKGHSQVADLLENSLDLRQDDVLELDPALTPDLVKACMGGDADEVKRLLAAGAMADAEGPDGRTPLIAAAAGGYVEIIRLLRKAGAGVNTQDAAGATPLMYAAKSGKAEAVETLLKLGANPAATDAQGRNAAFFAKEAGHAGICTYLQSLKKD